MRGFFKIIAPIIALLKGKFDLIDCTSESNLKFLALK